MSDLSGEAGDDGSGADDENDGARGRTFLVTGGNTGIGLATATALARRGGRVYVACRSAAAGEAAVSAIKAETGSATTWLLPLDLASLASVRSCAEGFLALDEPLHVLVNNAGVGGQRGLTGDGFEVHFGVNHLGHFALTMLLLDRLKASGPGARVVNVSSEVHYSAPGIDFNAVRRRTRSMAGMREYAVSKLSNVLFTQELARRVGGTGAGVTSLRAAPGRRRVRHLAPRAAARPVADHPPDADDRAGRGHIAVLRDLTGGSGGERPLLQQVRRSGTEPGRHA